MFSIDCAQILTRYTTRFKDYFYLFFVSVTYPGLQEKNFFNGQKRTSNRAILTMQICFYVYHLFYITARVQ